MLNSSAYPQVRLTIRNLGWGMTKGTFAVAVAMGSTALTGTMAFAADLPSRKAAPASYVRICDAYGAGFFYIPGTDTCIRVGGRVRAEYAINSRSAIILPPIIGNTNAYSVSSSTGITTPGTMLYVAPGAQDSTGMHARANINVDARTQTPWGTARTYISIRVANEAGLFSSNYTRGTFTGSGSTSPQLDHAFVQWAGFTFGHTRENFTFFPGTGYIAHRRAGFSSGINQLVYTANLGNGFSVTGGVEDFGNLKAAVTPGSLGGFTSPTLSQGGVLAASGPYKLPAFVGSLRWEQGWGTVQVMGAAVDNNASFSRPAGFATTTGNGLVVDKWGYALGAGLKLNLDVITKGDEFWFQGTYANGAMDWVISDGTSSQTSDLGVTIPGLQRVDRNMYVYGLNGSNASGGIPTAVGAELTKAYQLSGMYIHNWTPTVRQLFIASYLNVTPGTRTQNTDWALGGLSKANGYVLSSAVQWFPVKDFEIGFEVGYNRLNSSLTGTNGAAPSATGVPLVATNGSAWLGRMRVERNF